MKWVNWWIWDEPYGNGSMVNRRWTLSKWLDVSENQCPYQIEWIQWDMNELKWIERLEVKWVIWMKWARTTLWESPYGMRMNVPIKMTWVISMGISLWVDWECPYGSDLSEPNGILPMSWVSWTLSNWLEWYQWESPYELRMNVPIKLTWVKVKMNVPIKMIRID